MTESIISYSINHSTRGRTKFMYSANNGFQHFNRNELKVAQRTDPTNQYNQFIYWLLID